MVSWQRAALGTASILLASCAFIVNGGPEEFAAHCRFAGRETECGKCVALRCQRQVDACCDDAWCGGLIGAVEGCAQSSDARCAEIRSAKAGSEGERKDLATCASDFCRGVCEQAPPTSSSHCGETRFGAGSACVCTAGTPQLPANGYQCDPQIFPDTRCCAAPSWPAVGNQCTCLAVTCSPLRDGCSCSLSDAYSPAATHECHGICCQSDTVCRCGTDPCESPRETRVDACDATTTRCPERTVPVERCTLP